MEKSASARPRRLGGVALAVLLAIGHWASPVEAQRIRVQAGTRPAASADDEDAGPSNFAPPDRNVLQVLSRAKKALGDHRYGEALEGLAEVLRGNEDYFYQPDRKLSNYRSLKSEALELLGQMPREGRDLYEVRNGAEARKRLDRAVATGDAKALLEISGQFFHTQAGYEATYLLALNQMDRGTPLAGALTLKRLRAAGPAADVFEPGLSLTQAACYYQAGMMKECQQALVDLKRRSAKPSLQIDNRDVPWFEQDRDAAEWLARLTKVQRMSTANEAEQWTMFRGDPARNAATNGSAPLLNVRWRTEVADPALEGQLKAESESYRQRGVNVLSGLHPLAVGDYVLMRTANNLLAVDFADGKAKWETTEEEAPDSQANRVNNFAPRANMSQAAQYGQRIWDDATYGTLSSDGNLVFVIEQLNMGVTAQYNFIMAGPGRGDQERRSVTNKLVAYELQTGKRHWALGGDELLQPDTFFLGAPLPLRGQLFVMAEVKDEIRLLALDAATGNELWHQQLAMVDANIAQDPVRRLAGISPSYADGVLICPTGSGCVVAVDLASHSLLWGYIYPTPGQSPYAGMRRGRGMNQIQLQFMNPNGPVPRWLDGTATIAGGRVLLTPAEADALYCLNLADGKPCWKEQPRKSEDRNNEEHYYIACVHNGIVVLVGRNSIDAIKLEDGSKAWGGASIAYPSGETVSGHGFYAANLYYVPVSGGAGGEVLAVDVEGGKIVGTAKSRHSSPPGNLIAYRGRIISQGLDGVELYYQKDAAKADSAKLLTKNPNDVEGLTLRGEIAMDEGRSSDAVGDFRRAYALDESKDSHVRTRELLRDALLNGLRDNFALHRPLAGELEKLLDEPSQKSMYLRYMAIGLQRAGDWREAVESCLRLVDLDEKSLQLESIDRSYLARRDCWVQARLGMLRSEGGAASAAEIDKLLAPRLDDAKKDTGTEKLQRFISFFDGQPAAAAARTELFGRLAGAGRLMEAELLLSSGADSSDRRAQAALLADLATLYLRAKRVEDAAACYEQLARQFPDVPCQGDSKAAAWLAALSQGDALRKLIAAPAPSWPSGLVEVASSETSSPFNNNRGPRFDMVLSGPAGPFFTDYAISFENNTQEIGLRDGWGRMKSPIRLVENGRMMGFNYNPNSTVARTCGHLLLAAVGTKIYALDPWHAAGPEGHSILWSQDLTDASSDNDTNVNGGVMAINVAIANMNFNGMNNYHANPFGPVTPRVVCFQRVRNLVAVDPFRGEKLWVRQDIPPNSEVFGDDQYVFVVSPGSTEATVYRAIDGELLGTRKMPQSEPSEIPGGYYPNYSDSYERNGTLGTTGSTTLARYVLTWTKGPDADGRVLSLFDPWRQKAVWPARSFASGSRIDVVEQSVAGVMEPGGHFVLIDLSDGHTLADLQLKTRPHSPVMDLLVTRLGDQYIVVAQDRRSALEANSADQMQPIQGMLGYTLRRSRIYAIDMHGKLAWPEPVDIDHTQFPLSQPGRLPALVFCSYHFDQRNNQNQNNFRTVITAVDRRNGRVVCDENRTAPMRSTGLEIEGDAAERNVRVAANQVNVALKFTDKPLGKAVRASSGAAKPSGKLGDALLEAFEHAAGVPE